MRIALESRGEVSRLRNWLTPIAALAEFDGDRLRLSPRGVLLSNDVLQEFL